MKKYFGLLIIILALACMSVNVFANEYISDKLNISYKEQDEMIYGFEVEGNKITVKDILEGDYFSEGLNIEITDNLNNKLTDESKGVGTGNKIILSKNDEIVAKYKVVIYGDITGEGQITPVDALTLIKVINKKVQYIDTVCEEAGRITTREDGKTPSAVDALAIIKHLNNKYEITQNRSLFCWDKTSDAWKEGTTKNELNFKVIAKDEEGNRIEDITWEVSEGTLDTDKGTSVKWTVPNISNTYKITAQIDENNILEKEIKYVAFESIFKTQEMETEEVEIEEDGDEDKDGLTNIEEYELGTDVNYSDTDGDGLSDYEEVKTYKTNPLEKDTDQDEIEDLNEISLGLNPLSKDTDGDGILDNKEKVEYTAENNDLGVNIEIKGDANVADTIIDTVELNELDNIDAIVSPIYNFYTEGELEQAKVEIDYDESKLSEKGINEENLSLYYFDPTEYTFEKVNTQVDSANNKVKANLEHFSMYVVADKTTMVNEINNRIMFLLDNAQYMYTKEQVIEKDRYKFVDESELNNLAAYDSEYKRLDFVSKLIDNLEDDFEFALSKFAAVRDDLCEFGTSKDEINEKLEFIKTSDEWFDNSPLIVTTIQNAVWEWEIDSNSTFNKYMILITASDLVSVLDYEKIVIEECNKKGIKIITIAIGNKVDKVALRKISEETGGRFYHVQNVEDLDQIYSNVYSDLNLKRELLSNEDKESSEEEEDNVELEGYLVVANSGFTSEVNGFSFQNYRTSRGRGGQCFGMANFAKKFYIGDLELTGNKTEKLDGKNINFNYDLTSLEFFNSYTNLINYEFKSKAVGKIFKSSYEEIYDYDKLEQDFNAGIKKPTLEIREEYKEYIKETNGIIKTLKDDSGKATIYYLYVDMDELTQENLKKFPDFQLFKAIEFWYMSQFNEEGTGADDSNKQWFEKDGVEALEKTIEKINNGIPVNIGFETYSTNIISVVRRVLINTVGNHAVNGMRILRSIENPNEYKIAIYNNNKPGQTKYLTVEKVKTIFGNIKLKCYEQDGHYTNIGVEK